MDSRRHALIVNFECAASDLTVGRAFLFKKETVLMTTVAAVLHVLNGSVKTDQAFGIGDDNGDGDVRVSRDDANLLVAMQRTNTLR